MVVLAANTSRSGAPWDGSPPAANCRSRSAALTNSARAGSSKARPWPFSARRRPMRSNSGVPKCASSSCRAALLADWESAMAWPAAVVLPWSAMATKTCSWRSVRRMPITCVMGRFHRYYSFYGSIAWMQAVRISPASHPP
ncbi:hypothetical protein D3C71_1485010 [compost metagenome]